jgi:hypothetical protein
MMQEKEHIMFAMTCLKKCIDAIDQNSGKATVYLAEAAICAADQHTKIGNDGPLFHCRLLVIHF